MLRDNTARAHQARLTFLLLLLVSGALLGLGLLAPSADWEQVSTGEAPAVTLVVYSSYALLTLVSIGLDLMGYLVFIRWLRRAYYNLHQLPDQHPSYSDGWAAGAWFVPFINLARPYTIMREVWQGTQRAALGGEIIENNTLLGWWWAAHLVNIVVGRVTSHMSGDGTAITQRDVGLLTFNATFGLVAAWLTWRVIGQAAGFEAMLTARQQVTQLGQPVPAPVLPSDGQSDYALEGGY